MEITFTQITGPYTVVLNICFFIFPIFLHTYDLKHYRDSLPSLTNGF